jgi:hypothetical protein
MTHTVKRKTYPQNWRAYNAAQTSERATFQTLLRDLCKGIKEPPPSGRGRPTIPLADSIFAAVFKVYSTVSGRRFMTDLREAHDKGYIGRVPCYNSVFGVFESEATAEILQALGGGICCLIGWPVGPTCDSRVLRSQGVALVWEACRAFGPLGF